MAYDSEDAYSSTSSRSKGSGSKVKAALRGTGKALSSAGDQMLSDSRYDSASKVGPVQYRKGGKIGKSKSRSKAVPIIAHEDERVIPKSKRKKVERLMKRSGMNLTNRKRKARAKAR